VPIGKASFTEEQLQENLDTLLDAMKRARPPAVKGTYVRKIVMANTMGPGIKLDIAEAMP
jgi:large subunit ribosomal protein L1